MSRYKDFDATGIAPGGRLYAGDLNGIQDLKADRYNLAENLGTASLAVGEAGLILSRYGAGEARISGALRADGIVRGLGGLLLGAFTTAQRDAIPSGGAPFGLQILNTTRNSYEWNAGSDASRNWQGLGGGTIYGTYAARPAASINNAGGNYYATDKDALYLSNGSTWLRMQSQPGDITMTMNATARTGRVMAQGQTISRTGIYDELFALWGTQFNTGGEAGTDFRLPDWRARSPVMVGTDVNVNAIGKNEGVAVASRRGPKHRHTTHNHTLTDPGHFHTTYIGYAPSAVVYSGLQATPNIYVQEQSANSDTKQTGITSAAADGGSGVGADPLDGGAFIVCNVEIKL
jgi:microcystin-dependent protein